ncbi:uncharacterized protein LOC129146547 isoform X2 [Talpa occidentalis]|uniref:uncharacterized protein LOC129146547 isoform X2 n=1 Tax=Talpa occidentalis TaxID=50954 RepID=UPI0023F6F186|nr:uncharacterized protein LOC129146547 isoform X2 [Talpa occidentalis]
MEPGGDLEDAHGAERHVKKLRLPFGPGLGDTDVGFQRSPKKARKLPPWAGLDNLANEKVLVSWYPREEEAQVESDLFIYLHKHWVQSEARECERIHQSQSREQNSPDERKYTAEGSSRRQERSVTPCGTLNRGQGSNWFCKGCGHLRSPVLNHCATRGGPNLTCLSKIN